MQTDSNAPDDITPSQPTDQPIAATPPVATPLPKLFGRGAVLAATLIGSPVAGGIVLAINAARLRKWGNAAASIVAGLILTYSLLGLTPYAPGLLSLLLLPLGAAVMVWVAGALQADLLASHTNSGGHTGNVPAALLIGLVTAAGLYGLLYSMQPAAPKTIPLAKAQITDNQAVSFAPPVTQEEAQRVGKVLEAVGYFDKSGKPKEVLMATEADGRRVVVFPVDPAHAGDPQMLKSYALVAQQMVRAGVPIPFSIRLVGPGLKTISEFKVDVSATTHPAGQPPFGQPATSQPFAPEPFGLPSSPDQK